jgi:hypothetical protein
VDRNIANYLRAAYAAFMISAAIVWRLPPDNFGFLDTWALDFCFCWAGLVVVVHRFNGLNGEGHSPPRR